MSRKAQRSICVTRITSRNIAFVLSKLQVETNKQTSFTFTLYDWLLMHIYCLKYLQVVINNCVAHNELLLVHMANRYLTKRCTNCMYRQTNCLIVHHFFWAKRLASQTLYEQHYVLISLNGKEINKYQISNN